MRTLIVAMTVAVALSLHAAQTPARVPVDIELKTLTGAPRTDVVTIVVSFYAHRDSADPLWTEEQTVKPNEAGKLAVLAGATTDDGIPPRLFTSDEARWIGIAVKGEPEQPRIMVVSVPYAVRARDAERIDGHPGSDYVRIDELKERVREVFAEPAATASPRASAPQKQPASSIIAHPQNAPAPTNAVGSFSQLAPSGKTTGVLGLATSSTDGTDLDDGVTGVYGESNNTTGGGYSAGVRGINRSTNAMGYGVVGYHAGGGTAVWGQSFSGTGVEGFSNTNIGVIGIGTVFGVLGSGPLIGVRAQAGGSPGGVALDLYNGPMRVIGPTRAAFRLTAAPTMFTPANNTPMPTIVIDNPYSNGDPNATIYVTSVGQRFVLSNIATYIPTDNKPVYAAYITELGKWGLFHLDGSDMTATGTYDILIIKQGGSI